MSVRLWTPRGAFFTRVQMAGGVLAVFLSVAPLGLATAQDSASPAGPPRQANAQAAISPARAGTPLEDLLREAEASNPRIQAARQAWDAAKLAPSQLSVLPDPQFQLQHMSVGSPRPFAGYTNSDFAYIGLGVSQEFP